MRPINVDRNHILYEILFLFEALQPKMYTMQKIIERGRGRASLEREA